MFCLDLFALWSKGRDWLGARLDEVTSEGGLVFRIIGKGKKLDNQEWKGGASSNVGIGG